MNFKKYIINKFLDLLSTLLKKLREKEYDSFRNKYNISKDFKFNGNGIVFFGEGEIVIKENTYIGGNSYIQSSKNCSVVIGNSCAISHNVRIYTNSYISDQDFLSIEKKSYNKSVIIGNGVWIGANVLINPGVTIGDNAIVGANSVVTKAVSENSIVGGVPARLIRYKGV